MHTTGGLISTTGIAGLTLGGGIGWLIRKHGLACDNLVGATMITATSEMISVSQTSHPELLWALRGAAATSAWPDVDVIGSMPYVALQSMLDAGAPRGLRQYWKSGCLRTLDDDLLAAMGSGQPLPKSEHPTRVRRGGFP